MPAAKNLLVNGAGLQGVRTYVGPTFLHREHHILPPPATGQHSREILTEMLSYSVQTVAELLDQGVIR